METIKHLYIIGGGFTGASLAYELIIQNKAKKVYVIEKNKSNLFRGVAYCCNSKNYILNVKAKDLGFREENPIDFFNWLNQKYPKKYVESDFVSRNLYGQYLEERISPLLNKSIFHIEDNVVDIDLESQSLIGIKGTYPYENIYLAIGGGYQNPDLPSELVKQDDIYIKGTGLSAIDVVVDMYKKNFKGRFHLYSRHGLLPLPHDQGTGNFTCSNRLLDLFSSIKKIYKDQCETQYVIIQLRPKLETLWNGFTLKEKNQFKKFVKPYWEVFRHRVPEEHLNIINQLKMEERLIVSCQIEDVKYIDCTGFNKIEKNILYKNLIIKKIIVPDAFNWGASSKVSNLKILGPLQKFEKFEITAIKEIREEIRKLVTSI
jgi:uncharacterized NAD(P)/FAD-binding protein YdhS